MAGPPTRPATAVPDDAPGIRLYEDDARAIDALFQIALAQKGGNGFYEFLTFIARFRRHSVFNAMLILVQRPGARAVGTRHQWLSIGRQVNADAVPVVILRPFGPVDFVYEFGDTAGPPVSGEEEDPLRAVGQVPPWAFERTVIAASTCGISVQMVPNYGDGLAGTAARLHHQPAAHTELGGNNARWRIKLNGKLDEASRFATLAHELAHIYCGHLGTDEKANWPDRRALSTKQRELEAEAAAWLVCGRAGIETRSAQYLAPFITEDALRGISAFAIMSAAHRIEARGTKDRAPAKRMVPSVLPVSTLPLFGARP